MVETIKTEALQQGAEVEVVNTDAPKQRSHQGIEGNLRLQRIQDSGHHTEGWHQAAYRTYRTREEQMPKGGGKAV